MANKQVSIIDIILAIILVPVVLGSVGYIITGCTRVVSWVAFRYELRKGLKDGSVIKHDGIYYNVEINTDEG
jgi:hypothetical protein